jgi:hypothetical protein
MGFAFDRISETRLIDTPFPQLIISNVFPEEFYQFILSQIPLPEEMHRRRNIDLGINQNRCIVDASVLGTSFWDEFVTWFGGRRFAEELLRKFGAKFEDHYYVTTQLVQDRIGYEIGPHSDIASKVLTIVFYLPLNNSTPECGTSICRTLDPSLVGMQRHHSWDSFEESHVLLYKRNTAMAFRRTDRSFHAVRSIQANILRNTIAVTVRTH